jgi:hypothetical protein
MEEEDTERIFWIDLILVFNSEVVHSICSIMLLTDEVLWYRLVAYRAVLLWTISKKRSPSKYNYTLHGHILEHDTSAKYLGCTISSDLKWGKHISTIINNEPVVL